MTNLPDEIKDTPHARHQLLLDWTKAALSSAKLCPETGVHLTAISGDAGFRQYYRIANTHPSMLAVDAPPETEKNHAFCHIAQLLRQHGIHTPKVYAVDYNKGFLLLEDLGDALYFPLLAGDDQKVLYRDAENCLLKIHQIPIADAGLAAYDAEKLQQEMDLFPQWFVKQLLQIEMTAETTEYLQKLNQLLIQSAMEQPQVVVHRDFHCRNLLHTTNNNPGVIDFQDAVIGAITYDLVSLYRDCYICWPPEQVTQWVLDYRNKLLQNKIIDNISEQEFLRWFDWMGLQRHIKVLGIFARLFLRDKKSGYLKDLPLVMHYTLSVAKQYPEFSNFVFWFEHEILPKAKQCAWYKVLKTEIPL